jgi:MarR family transcriptional regulator, organic hydroperoxide resistance regulator
MTSSSWTGTIGLVSTETTELTDAALVGLLFTAAQAAHVHYERVASRHGLTVQQAKFLRSLEGPQPMRAMAIQNSCDPSNVTGVIDRIERLGLVQRTPDPSDRRVRLLSLTPEGRRVRRKIDSELDDVPVLAGLGARERSELARLLALIRPDP